MRQAINNLQSTWSGFGYVNDENVFKVCDQPHPVVVNAIIASCLQVKVDNALEGVHQLWRQGYSAVDIITTLFRVVKFYDGMPEFMKLDYIKVSLARPPIDRNCACPQWIGTTFLMMTISCARARQEIGLTHMKILEGVTSLIQLGGLISRLCKLSMDSSKFTV